MDTWTLSPEQFVQDEDEESYSYSVRISAQELIEELATASQLISKFVYSQNNNSI